MTPTEFVDGASWLGREFLKFFHTPVGVAGGMIDTFRGWKFSRSWVRVWFNLPSLVFLITVYLVFGFAVLGRSDSRIQLLSVKSERKCSTQLMEDIYAENCEEKFSKVPGLTKIELLRTKSVPLWEVSQRYIELLSKRILSIEPKNQTAHYRLGLIYSLTEKHEAATLEMLELANGKYGECFQANAWMAKDFLQQRVDGIEVSTTELVTHLEKAAKWKNVDSRLVVYYARILEEMGDVIKAIALTKQAAANRPELNLDLARLYYRQGYQAETRSVAMTVEEIFLKKLNLTTEKESDRLAVAEARRMTDRLDLAAAILEEALKRKFSGPATRRELSEIYRLIYLKSVFKTEAGPYQVDLSQLEKVAHTDPTNPNVSNEIAKLLPLKIAPTMKLMDTLRKQIDEGILTASTYALMAETYYESGNMARAIKNWESALDKEPDNVTVLNNLALVLAKESENNVDRSIDLLSRAVALAPNNAEVLDSLGDVLMIAKRPKDAINKFELAIRIDTQRMGTRKKLFDAYQSNGMEDMAKALKKVIDKMEKAKADEEARLKNAVESN